MNTKGEHSPSVVMGTKVMSTKVLNMRFLICEQTLRARSPLHPPSTLHAPFYRPSGRLRKMDRFADADLVLCDGKILSNNQADGQLAAEAVRGTAQQYVFQAISC